MKTITTVLLLFIVSATLRSQQDPTLPVARIGGYADYNRNIHDAAFSRIPGVPGCCPRYESGQGTGISFGALYDLPLSELLSLQLRAGYATHGGSLTSVEQTSLIVEGERAPGAFEHRMEATLSDIGIEPLAGLRILPDLSVHAGMRAGYMISGRFSQRETIIQPEGSATFIDSNGHDSRRRTRNEIEGAIPDASEFYLALLGGVSYDLPLDREKRIVASPEIFYAMALTDVARAISWRSSSVRAGISFRFMIPEGSDQASITTTGNAMNETPVVPTPPVLSATIEAVGVDAGGNERPDVAIRVRERVTSRMTPLLNQLFFDDGAGELPGRYIRLAPDRAPAFTIASLHGLSTLPTYHHLLNIIGRRMTDHPEATLTLTGCNAGVGSEAGNRDLSRRRAESVRDYLTSVWRIAGERIAIVTADLPSRPATPITDQEKIEENRRVEITSNVREIIEPVFTSDTTRTADPAIIRFKPAAVAGAGIGDWSITVMQGARELGPFGNRSSDPAPIDWDLPEELLRGVASGEAVSYMLTVRDSADRQITTPIGAIPIERTTTTSNEVERQGEIEIERFSLILFDFDDAVLAANNLRIAELVRRRIRAGSRVTVTGYTDRTGEGDRNRSLAARRSESVRAVLGGGAIEARGVGEAVLLYDNALPEGRSYCRTVEIVVATPALSD